jgi:hypothetical protein
MTIRDELRPVISFSRPLASYSKSLTTRIHQLSPPYSLKSIMEIEVALDNITEELNVLSSRKVTSLWPFC